MGNEVPKINTRSVGHNPIAIANHFIKLSKGRKPLYLLALIKLPYIAHGFTLAILNEPLSYEPAEVWPYGPVFPSIFYAFKKQPKPFEEPLDYSDSPLFFSDNHRKIMQITYDKYHKFTASQLSAMTHAEGTPWSKARENKDLIINNDEIRQYYLNLLNQ